jgi:hypothetical protein
MQSRQKEAVLPSQGQEYSVPRVSSPCTEATKGASANIPTDTVLPDPIPETVVFIKSSQLYRVFPALSCTIPVEPSLKKLPEQQKSAPRNFRIPQKSSCDYHTRTKFSRLYPEDCPLYKASSFAVVLKEGGALLHPSHSTQASQKLMTMPKTCLDIRSPFSTNQNPVHMGEGLCNAIKGL